MSQAETDSTGTANAGEPASEAPSGGAEAPAAPASENAPEETASKQTLLVFGAVVVVLVIVLAIRLPTITAKFEFRKLRQGITAPDAKMDETKLNALLKPIQDRGDDVLTAATEELESADPALDFYRVVIVDRVVGPMKSPDATKVLLALTFDQRDTVRAQAYSQLATRVGAQLATAADVLEPLKACTKRESNPVARAFLFESLVRVEPENTALWELIKAVRHLPPEGRPYVARLVKTISGAVGREVALDTSAPAETQIRQMHAIEAAYQERGGTIPPGEDLKSVLEKKKQAPGAPAPTPEGEGQ